MRKQTVSFQLLWAVDICTSHKAIIAYLTSVNLPQSAAFLRQELDIGESFDATTTKKYEGLLEKKWTSVVRLQKKVNCSSGNPICVHRN